MKEYINEAIWAIMGGVMAFFVKKYNDLKLKNEATQEGVKSLLRDRIVASYEQYKREGYMPSYVKENVEELYRSYKKLGGNSFIDDLIIKIYALPCEKE